MGQYYKPSILGKNKKTVIKWLYSHSFSNGLKLMEHSWIGNGFVRAVESLLFKNPQIIVWAGDYAENCKNRKTNIYSRATDAKEVKPVTDLTDKECRYVVNHDKKLFVDTTKVPVTDTWVNPKDATDTFDYKIHPLPLLTSEGNGSGGGDFRGNDPKNIIGSWARNLVSIEQEAPSGYTELIFDLVE